MFMNIWREVWTDGRALPTNFARGADAHDPTYNGYSVGRWEDDYTFVVDTTGMAPETWVARAAGSWRRATVGPPVSDGQSDREAGASGSGPSAQSS